MNLTLAIEWVKQRIGTYLVIIALAVGMVTGLTLGWMLWRPAPVGQEPPAPEIRQADHSVVLERKPESHPAVPHQIPSGAKLEREIQVTVQPSAGVTPLTTATSPVAPGKPPEATPCPPVIVDLSLVRMPDKTRRVIASSPDGDVVGGLDVPVEAASVPRELKWAVGGLYGSKSEGGQTLGVFVDRDFAFLRTGVEITRERYTASSMNGWEIRGRLGIRF